MKWLMWVIAAVCGVSLVADVVHLAIWPHAWLLPGYGVALSGLTLAGSLHRLHRLNPREATR